MISSETSTILSSTQRTVIIGASLAGLSAAEALRAEGFSGTLTVIGDELYAPYDRPPLSKTVLKGWRQLSIQLFHRGSIFMPNGCWACQPQDWIWLTVKSGFPTGDN